MLGLARVEGNRWLMRPQTKATTLHRGCVLLHTTKAAAAEKTTTRPRSPAVHGDKVLLMVAGQALSHAVSTLQTWTRMPHRDCVEMHAMRTVTAVDIKQHPWMVAGDGQQGWTAVSHARQPPVL